jgi:hypothetical protein
MVAEPGDIEQRQQIDHENGHQPDRARRRHDDDMMHDRPVREDGTVTGFLFNTHFQGVRQLSGARLFIFWQDIRWQDIRLREQEHARMTEFGRND